MPCLHEAGPAPVATGGRLMAGGGPTYTRAGDNATAAEQEAAGRLVRRMVSDPAARQEVLESLGLTPYTHPGAAGYKALAAAIAGQDEP